ncbi:hypothetical protein QVD17_18548 [Tagetes erecta]|uniref:Uncharacterized protein n=1 Tax=Tagetes erecta TaxID=13708 RepID=A0AAD8KLE0_TARER|nr:hypothetical protein QVD17_18548 [Tagetes erecta]
MSLNLIIRVLQGMAKGFQFFTMFSIEMAGCQIEREILFIYLFIYSISQFSYGLEPKIAFFFFSYFSLILDHFQDAIIHPPFLFSCIFIIDSVLIILLHQPSRLTSSEVQDLVD